MFYFESLVVYQKSFSINQKVYRFLKQNHTIPLYIKNQLGRACSSIMLNIAEGTGRRSAKDRRNFLIISRGSALECVSLIRFLTIECDIPESLGQKLYEELEEVSKMLYSMIRNYETNN